MTSINHNNLKDKISHEEYMKILENLHEENMKKIKEEYEQKMKEIFLSFEKTESFIILNKDNNILIIKKDTKENNKEINENNNIGIIKEEDIFKMNKDEFNNINISNEKNEDNNLNKKRKRNNNKNYFNSDKIIKKIRVSILKAIIRFINKKIEIDFNNNLGIGINLKQFLQISKKDLSHSKINFDQEFLRKTLKEILSFNISEKYSNYISTHNKNLVNYLLNLDNKGENYKKLFELTFLDCIEYIRGTKYINILDGLDKIDDIVKYVKYIDEDEMENFKHYLLNYESILYGKRPRNSKYK